MILRATFKNILSFKEETSISFVAGKGSLHPEHVVRAEKRDDISVLRTGVVYGANASGKSNFIKAIRFLQLLVFGKSPFSTIEPFKTSNPSNETSKIELEIKLDKRYFAYGVEFNIHGIKEEWLYEINSRSDREIFTRQTSNTGNTFTFSNFEGNKEAKLFLKFLGAGTPADKTFLSEYVKRNGNGLEDIKTVYQWFKKELKIIFPNTRYKGLSIRIEKDSDFQHATNNLLRHFNTGITSISRIPIKAKEDTGIPAKILERMERDCKPGERIMLASSSDNDVFFFERKENGALEIFKQIAVHGHGDSETKFAMNEESDGTNRLLDFIPMLIDLKRNPVVYLIDELDRSMHPMMTFEIIQQILSDLNPDVESQIIFSTHESNLLNLELLRSDEIWFVEKDNEGASRFTSLAEYKPRADIRKGYLLGRYGAVPFFAAPETLKWNEE